MKIPPPLSPVIYYVQVCKMQNQNICQNMGLMSFERGLNIKRIDVLMYKVRELFLTLLLKYFKLLTEFSFNPIRSRLFHCLKVQGSLGSLRPAFFTV